MPILLRRRALPAARVPPQARWRHPADPAAGCPTCSTACACRHRADAIGRTAVPALSEPPCPASSLGVLHGPAKSQEQRARLTVGFNFLLGLASATGVVRQLQATTSHHLFPALWSVRKTCYFSDMKAAVGADVNPPLFAGEDAVFGEGQSRLVVCKDEAPMAP